ncbi:MAG: ImmA/IrrE family metallo-endopeptidase [Chloroflexi bacterium]|nr:ImmA/IrrE family metallo-endopeptidase [Chloroflexota bacterium]
MEQGILETLDLKILGRRLQEARKARGLTQQDVAESLSVARTTVTSLEKGDRRVRPEELIQLARLFGRTVGDFVSDREPSADLATQLRAAAEGVGSSDIRSVIDQAIQDFQRLCEDYLYLEKLNGLQPVRVSLPQYPMQGIPPEDAAEDVASAERNRLALGDSPILNLRDLLEADLGLRIFYLALPPTIAAMYAYSDERGGCIAANASYPEEQRRLALAHAYGHFLTNRYRAEIALLGGYERVPAFEQFADAFARAFLMPNAGLRRRFNEYARLAGRKMTATELTLLAQHYRISVEAIFQRLESLRILPSDTWERMREQSLSFRELPNQPAPSQGRQDDELLPRQYQFLAVRAFQEGNLTEGELARLLRLDRVQTRRLVQRLTQHPHVSGEGKPGVLTVDLTSTLGKQDA